MGNPFITLQTYRQITDKDTDSQITNNHITDNCSSIVLNTFINLYI